MPPDADILDRPEPMTVPFWVSIVMHVLLVGGLLAGVLEERKTLNMGNPNGGGFGSLMVNPVASIPLPNRGGPENPVANDTASQVPTPPAPKEKAKAAAKVKAPPLDAIALKSGKAPKRLAEAAQQPNKFRDTKEYSPSQLYTPGGQRLSSSQFAIQGGDGVKLGDSSPFGEQFGAYANIIRDSIARNWRPSELNLRTSAAPYVVMRFTILRDGSITNVSVARSSGISTMDNSAERAVRDAHLSPLPGNFPRNQADVELKFELGN